MRQCRVPPPPIIFERLKLPEQIIHCRKGNLSQSPNHIKYWENILISWFYEQFLRSSRNLGHFWKFRKHLTLSRRQTGFAVCASWALRSKSRKTGSRAFLVHSFAKRGCIWTEISQTNLNVISLERGEFKLSIGGLNNNIPYTVQKLSKILQPAWSWQIRDFNMVLKAEAKQPNKWRFPC